MYQAFDSYLSRPTLHTDHSLEDKAFYAALKEVVHEEDFSPENMKEYFVNFVGTKANRPDIIEVFDKRGLQADAVRDFLKL